MVEVELCGVKIKVDEDNIPLIKSRKWHLSKGDAKKGYTYFRWMEYDGPKQILHLLHREIAGVPKGSKLVVDHIDRDTTNNTRENLRIVTRGENTLNSGIQSVKRSSKYKGVYFNKKVGKYKAEIRVSNKSHFLGYFISEEEAAETADIYYRHINGELAYINFPDKVYPEERIKSVIASVHNKVCRTNTTGYNGVANNRTKGKFTASCKHNGKNVFIGDFLTIEEAYIARCKYLDEHPEIKVRR